MYYFLFSVYHFMRFAVLQSKNCTNTEGVSPHNQKKTGNSLTPKLANIRTFEKFVAHIKYRSKTAFFSFSVYAFLSPKIAQILRGYYLTIKKTITHQHPNQPIFYHSKNSWLNFKHLTKITFRSLCVLQFCSPKNQINTEG